MIYFFSVTEAGVQLRPTSRVGKSQWAWLAGNGYEQNGSSLLFCPQIQGDMSMDSVGRTGFYIQASGFLPLLTDGNGD